MSDSESELSSAPAIPSDASLEKSLRDAVAKLFENGDRDNLTVKRIRIATEKALDLPEEFFKGDAKWKAKSDMIIREETEMQEAVRNSSQKTEESPEKPKAKPKAENKSTKPPKRASPDEPSKLAKRQKKVPSNESEDELSSLPSDVSEENPKKARKPAKASKPAVKPSRAKATPKPKKEEKVVDSEEDENPAPNATGGAKDPNVKDPFTETPEKANGAAKTADSESELSEVLDPIPKPKQQKRKSSESSTKPEKKAKKPANSKDDPNPDPDEAEIKKLQGWLIKCGIRKMWYRELAPYDTPKEKIRHLRGLLKDAGMDGRYSNEKARQIKEERELKADLDMVREGAKRWGADSDNSDVDDKGKPRRRLARGLRDVDFLGSDDGEETS